jgi:hypothetical protein
VRWTLGGNASAIAALSLNDTLPRYFGPNGETVSCRQDVYAAVVFQEGALPILVRAWPACLLARHTGRARVPDAARRTSGHWWW